MAARWNRGHFLVSIAYFGGPTVTFYTTQWRGHPWDSTFEMVTPPGAMYAWDSTVDRIAAMSIQAIPESMLPSGPTDAPAPTPLGGYA